MEQRLRDELLHARRSFRKIAAQLCSLLLTKPARDVRPIGPRSRGSFPRCHAIADLADQWLRSGQIPTADEWASLKRRVHRISAIIDLWDEQATPDGSPLPLAR